MVIVYKGVTTKKRYSFSLGFLPAVLLQPGGTPVAQGTFNGETLIMANTDGSVARGAATGPPAGAATVATGVPGAVDIYSAYVAPSAWESQGPVYP